MAVKAAIGEGSMTSTPSLPQEVLDHILDHLHDDKETLSSCTLVARCFLESAQHHYFDSLHLTINNSNSGGETGLDSLELFATTIVEFAKPAQRVRKLYISGQVGAFGRTDGKVTHGTLVVLLNGLPSLTSLALAFVLYVPPIGDSQLPPKPRKLAHLSLHDLFTMSLDSVQTLLGLFSQIDLLHIYGSHELSLRLGNYEDIIQKVSLFQRPPVTPELRVRSLRLGSEAFSTFALELLRSSPGGNLVGLEHIHLALPIFGGVGCRALQAVLDLIPSKLVSLRLTLPVSLNDWTCAPVRGGQSIDLAPCSTLRTLSFDVADAMGQSFHYHFLYIANVLSKLPLHNDLQCLTLNLEHFAITEPMFTLLSLLIKDVDWEMLGDLLMNRLPNLTSLVFRAKMRQASSYGLFCFDEFSEIEKDFIRGKLGTLHARGTLKFAPYPVGEL